MDTERLFYGCLLLLQLHTPINIVGIPTTAATTLTIFNIYNTFHSIPKLKKPIHREQASIFLHTCTAPLPVLATSEATTNCIIFHFHKYKSRLSLFTIQI